MLSCITDESTASCLKAAVHIRPLLPFLENLQLCLLRPEMIFIESAWQGWRKSWKYKIAAYPDNPKRNNHALLRLLEYAGKLHIPTVFWDKEGLTHFDRFIDSARHFDHVFTVDAETIPKYKAVMGENASVHVLPFAVQPKFHFFDGFHFTKNTATFAGSYSMHVHPHRRIWQEMFFRTALDSGLGLHVFDRNSDRKSRNYRYPAWEGIQVHPVVSNARTADIYKQYLVSLNVNTNESSPTMVSRRLVEVLACGGIAVTNPTAAVMNEYAEYCHVVHDKKEAMQLFERLKHGPSKQDLERARAGADYISRNHTWEQRLKFIREIIR